MYYSNKERINIGKEVYTQVLSKSAAAKRYEISEQCVINYVKAYLKSENIPYIPEIINSLENNCCAKYKEMSKNDLINELMQKDIELARSKKGYAVRGHGKAKEFISLKDVNMK